MRKMIVSAFSDEYAESFEEQLEGMNRFGINHIELRHVDGKSVARLSKSEANDVKNMMEHFGVRASAIASPLGKIRLDGDRKEHLETARRIFELAAFWGVRFVRIFSFYAPEGEAISEMKDEVINALGEMILLAREYPVTLCHENEANIYGDTPLRCRELLDCFGGELKCVFDMGNFVLEEVTPFPDAYGLLKKDIAYFHIKDALFRGAVVPPGKGEAKIKEILEAHSTCSDGDFFATLEPHLQTFSGKNALVGRCFENPYKYADAKSAFADAVIKFREIVKL